MRILPLVAVCCLALSPFAHGVSPQAASDAPPPNAPMDPPMPPGMHAPSHGWGAADLSPEAIKKAEEFLHAAHKVYSAAPGIRDESTISLIMSNGKDGTTLKLALGAGDDLHAVTRDLEMIVKGDKLYMVLSRVPGKYLTSTVKGSVDATASELVGEFSLGAPTVALRRMEPGPDYGAKVFGLGAPTLQDLKIAGSRLNDKGKQEILLKGGTGEVLAEADPTTHLFTRSFILVPRDPSNPELKLPIEMIMDPKLLPEPPAIAFDPGDRVAFFSGAELSKALAVEKQEADAGKQTPATAKKSVAIGAVAPLAVLETLDGKTFDLASLKGKVVVLDLWATWCGPCIRGLPVLQSFADEMKSNPAVAVYAVNSIEQPLPPGMKDPPESYRTGLLSKVSAFWEKSKFTMTTLVDVKSSLFEQYGFEGIPATIIIGSDGKLVSSHTGFSPNMLQTLRAEVAKALAAAPADAATSN